MIVLSAGGRNVIDLRNPEFGNTEKLEITRINRSTRGGDLVIFRDPAWPQTKTLDYQLANLTATQAQSLLSFLEQFVGQTITLTDFEGTVWTGVITTPAAEVIQDGIGRFTASFTFQATV